MYFKETKSSSQRLAGFRCRQNFRYWHRCNGEGGPNLHLPFDVPEICPSQLTPSRACFFQLGLLSLALYLSLLCAYTVGHGNRTVMAESRDDIRNLSGSYGSACAAILVCERESI